jgi:hypothetical protein
METNKCNKNVGGERRIPKMLPYKLLKSGSSFINFFNLRPEN